MTKKKIERKGIRCEDCGLVLLKHRGKDIKRCPECLLERLEDCRVIMKEGVK